jgi:hypothetical protein
MKLNNRTKRHLKSERKLGMILEDLLEAEEAHQGAEEISLEVEETRGVEVISQEVEVAHQEVEEISPEEEALLEVEEISQEAEVAALQEVEETSPEEEEDHQEVAHLEVETEVDLEVETEEAQEVVHRGVAHQEVDLKVEKEGHSEVEVLPLEAVNDLYLSFQLIKTLIHKIYCFFRWFAKTSSYYFKVSCIYSVPHWLMHYMSYSSLHFSVQTSS